MNEKDYNKLIQHYDAHLNNNNIYQKYPTYNDNLPPNNQVQKNNEHYEYLKKNKNEIKVNNINQSNIRAETQI